MQGGVHRPVMDQFKLQDKVALVTGAGRNLGRAIAFCLAEAGAAVALAARSLPEAEKAAAEIGNRGGIAMAVVMDVTRFSQVEAAMQQVVAEFGRIDILVNNAATRSHKPLIEMTEQEWQSVIDTNLTGAFLCCKAVGPYMIRQGGGRVINISSRAGSRGRADITAYCASKGGLEQLTRALALEWAPYRILVNAVAPGIINTDRSYAGATAIPTIPKARIQEIPLKRAAEMADILPLVLYFASEASSYTTGQVVLVDGGVTAQ